jgi:hypothetical protein
VNAGAGGAVRGHAGSPRARIQRTPILLVALALLAVSPASLASQENAPDRADTAAFLSRMAGEWRVTTEAVLAPGQPPVRSEGHASARMLGTRWLVTDTEGETPTGTPVYSVFTLGFDEVAGEIVGTWIDSMQGTMWRYRGTLDGDRGVLQLETEGPVMGNPEVITRYREEIEFLDEDRRVTRSSILGPDGAWFEYGMAAYRRIPEG